MSNIKSDDRHLFNLIKWLIEEVRSMGGDGDGIWYTRNYHIDYIYNFIKENNLLPSYWNIEIENNSYLYLGENQESLIITDDKKLFNSRPSWQQVAIEW